MVSRGNLGGCLGGFVGGSSGPFGGILGPSFGKQTVRGLVRASLGRCGSRAVASLASWGHLCNTFGKHCGGPSARERAPFARQSPLGPLCGPLVGPISFFLASCRLVENLVGVCSLPLWGLCGWVGLDHLPIQTQPQSRGPPLLWHVRVKTTQLNRESCPITARLHGLRGERVGPAGARAWIPFRLTNQTHEATGSLNRGACCEPREPGAAQPPLTQWSCQCSASGLASPAAPGCPGPCWREAPPCLLRTRRPTMRSATGHGSPSTFWYRRSSSMLTPLIPLSH